MQSLFLKLCMPGIIALAALPGGAETRIVIDAARQLGPVNRFVFGHNLEAADSANIHVAGPDANTSNFYRNRGDGYWDPRADSFAQPVLEATRRVAPGMLRYPGGCLVHNYDWRKTVGPRSQRPDWQFGLEEYLALCRKLNSEPMITCSDYVLPAEEMPAHLAALVEYLNAPATPEHPWAMKRGEWGHPEPYNVKYFELGNESEHGNHFCKPRRCFTKEEYENYAGKSAKAMREVDPSIKLGVLHGMTGAYGVADFLIRHPYGPDIDGRDLEKNFKSAMAFPDHLARRFQKDFAEVRTKYGRELPFACTEYNLLFFAQKPVPWRFSAMAGLYCADLLRMFLEPENHVMSAHYWQITNGWFGFMTTSPDNKVVPRGGVMPYFRMWAEHFDGNLLPVSIVDSPRFTAPATVDMPSAAGTAYQPEKRIGRINYGSLHFDGLKPGRIDGNSPETGELEFVLSGNQGASYTNIGGFQNRLKNDGFYRMSFESRFIPEPGKPATANVGLSLLDSRGWDKTSSAMAVDSLEKDRKWTFHQGDFMPIPGCAGIDILFRVPNAAVPSFGKLEVRNFKIESWIPARQPAYAGLTASGAISEDGKKLRLMVFNKSFDQSIESTIDLGNFDAAIAKSWTLAPPPDTMTAVEPEEREIELPAAGSPLKLKFPAHSMTALEFVRR